MTMRQDEAVSEPTEPTDPMPGATDATADDMRAEHDRDADGMDDRLEMLLTGVFAMAAASVARKVASGIWKASTGRTPPQGGKDGRADLGVIILWGAMAGAAAGIARAVAERQAAKIAQSRRARD
jgi:Protein of unknown function (DUF4235)